MPIPAYFRREKARIRLEDTEIYQKGAPCAPPPSEQLLHISNFCAASLVQFPMRQKRAVRAASIRTASAYFQLLRRFPCAVSYETKARRARHLHPNSFCMFPTFAPLSLHNHPEVKKGAKRPLRTCPLGKNSFGVPYTPSPFATFTTKSCALVTMLLALRLPRSPSLLTANSEISTL